MDAIILAAGLGTRLRPHTETTPKPLLTVRGRPILDWTLGALPSGVDRVIVVVEYLGHQIEEYLRRQKHVASAEVVWQGTPPRGTGDAVRKCAGRLRGGSFLVLNGDDLYGAADLAELARQRAGLLVREVSDPEKWGIAFVKADGSLEKLVEKPKGLAAPQLANAGAYVFPEDVFTTELKLSARGEYEVTDYVTAEAAKGEVRPVKCRFWLPIGDVAAWQAAQGVELEGVMTRR
jgi:bifunctional UDP-N-acetylglucosamine pyrophosphorylase/glucosamine-1-phosphate N-acetyltransferase